MEPRAQRGFRNTPPALAAGTMESGFEQCLAAAMPHIKEFVKRQDAADADMGGGRAAADLLEQLGASTPESALPDEAADDLTGFAADIQQVLSESVATGHPNFLDKLYARPTPEGLVGDFVLSLVNSNAHTYAVAPVLLAVEVAVGRALRRLFGCARRVIPPPLLSRLLTPRFPGTMSSAVTESSALAGATATCSPSRSRATGPSRTCGPVGGGARSGRSCLRRHRATSP